MPGPPPCHYRPCIFCPVGRGLDPSAASRRRSLAPTKKSPPSGCGSGWGLGVSVCVRRNHVPELRLRLRNPVPIYYRITAKKLCFSYEQFVNYRAAGPNVSAAPFFAVLLYVLAWNVLVILKYADKFMKPDEHYYKLFVRHFHISGFDPVTPLSNHTSIKSSSRFIGLPEAETKRMSSTYGRCRSMFFTS